MEQNDTWQSIGVLSARLVSELSVWCFLQQHHTTALFPASGARHERRQLVQAELVACRKPQRRKRLPARRLPRQPGGNVGARQIPFPNV